MNKILIIAAHPDDEVLGCFGTVSKMIKNGDEAYTLILSKGKTSRNEGDKEQELLYQEMQNANALIGIKKVFQLDFPDNAFDSVPLLSIIQAIEEIKEDIKPNIIFTHFRHDINIDHQITSQAVLTAARPIKGETVKEIYFMEIPSSTEWNSFTQQTAFIPNVFSDITDTINDKINAMKLYQSELRESTYPRSLEHLKLYSKTNGIKVGLDYSENFILVRKEI